MDEIIVDSEEEYRNVLAFLERFPSNVPPPRVNLHRGNIPILEFYGIEKDLESPWKERYGWGRAYLVIDQTEALTVDRTLIPANSRAMEIRGAPFEDQPGVVPGSGQAAEAEGAGWDSGRGFYRYGGRGGPERAPRHPQGTVQERPLKGEGLRGVTPLGHGGAHRKRARSDIRASFTRGVPSAEARRGSRGRRALPCPEEVHKKGGPFRAPRSLSLYELHPTVASFVADMLSSHSGRRVRDQADPQAGP